MQRALTLSLLRRLEPIQAKNAGPRSRSIAQSNRSLKRGSTRVFMTLASPGRGGISILARAQSTSRTIGANSEAFTYFL